MNISLKTKDGHFIGSEIGARTAHNFSSSQDWEHEPDLLPLVQKLGQEWRERGGMSERIKMENWV